MMGFGKKAPKSPEDLVAAIVEDMSVMDHMTKEEKKQKAVATLSQHVETGKLMLVGASAEEPPKPEDGVAFAGEAVKHGLVRRLMEHLEVMEFEARKDSVQVIAKLLRTDVGGKLPVAEWMALQDDLLKSCLKGYEKQETALNLGMLVRELNRNETLSRMMLGFDEFWNFFSYVSDSNFEIASDAFTTLKELLTRHKAIVAQLLTDKYDEFFSAYKVLLDSENYITRRQSLKLLGELLLDRSNTAAMMKYITNPENLVQMMKLLKDSSKSIQFEAFHVFKVFVANPNKPDPIINLLAGNKPKLLKYLSTFHEDKDDDQFREEKDVLIRCISELDDLAPAH